MPHLPREEARNVAFLQDEKPRDDGKCSTAARECGAPGPSPSVHRGGRAERLAASARLQHLLEEYLLDGDIETHIPTRRPPPRHP
jgi:hypothetical protein